MAIGRNFHLFPRTGRDDDFEPQEDVALERSQHRTVLVAALIGVLTGLAVAGFERLASTVMFDHLVEAPRWLQVVAPGLGLVGAALCLRYLAAGADSATADEYVRAFHAPESRIDQRPVIGRMLAGIATLGTGGALGYEGPAVYVGAALGSGVRRSFGRIVHRSDARALMVAGAAAGVSAVFKAPATGVLFALEVPYIDDVARRSLLPALAASAAGYLTYIALVGSTPLFSLASAGYNGFGLIEIVGAVVIGVLAGLGARIFARCAKWAKHVSHAYSSWVRVPVCAVAMGLLGILTFSLYHEALDLGPGYRTYAWVADPKRALGLVALLLVIRLAVTTTTLAGGGVGGLFIPLVIQGLLLGRFVAGAIDGMGLHPSVGLEATSTLFPILGVAAFLGAGYRTPIAAVMFVAETTGKAVFVVPALLAATVSLLVMGRRSVSTAQVSTRAGHLERRFRLPVSVALRTDVLTVPPDATVAEFVRDHVIGNRQRVVPVADGHTYVGMVTVEAATAVDQDDWETTTVADIVPSDLPVGSTSWKVRDAVEAMDASGLDRVAVVDKDGSFVGEVRWSELLELDTFLRQTGR